MNVALVDQFIQMCFSKSNNIFIYSHARKIWLFPCKMGQISFHNLTEFPSFLMHFFIEKSRLYPQITKFTSMEFPKLPICSMSECSCDVIQTRGFKQSTQFWKHICSCILQLHFAIIYSFVCITFLFIHLKLLVSTGKCYVKKHDYIIFLPNAQKYAFHLLYYTFWRDTL